MTARDHGPVDSTATVAELVAAGYTVGDAIAARAFGRWLAIMGPAPLGPDAAPLTSPSIRAAAIAAELGVDYYTIERALVAYASGIAGADRELLVLLGEPLP